MNTYFSKTYKALMALYLIITIILAGSIFVYYDKQSTAALNILEQQMIHVNGLRSDEFTNLIQQYSPVITILGQEILTVDPQLDDEKSINRLLNLIVDQSSQVVAISVADPTGHQIASTNANLGQQIAYANNSYPGLQSFESNSKDNHLDIGRPYQIEIETIKSWVVPVSLVSNNGDNTVIVSFSVSFDNSKKIENSTIVGDNKTFIIREDGFLQMTPSSVEGAMMYDVMYDIDIKPEEFGKLTVKKAFNSDLMNYQLVTKNEDLHFYTVTISDINLLLVETGATKWSWFLLIAFVILTIVFIAVTRVIISYEKKLINQAEHDSLTGLANRSKLHGELQSRILTAKETDTKVAVFFIDLDDFKQVNDTYNHFVGDQLLIKVATRFVGILRNDDFVARLGGDEFVVISSNHTNARRRHLNVNKIADQIHNATTDRILVDEIELYSNSSIGIAVYPNDAKTTTELLRKADLAMYKSKHLGKNQFIRYTTAIETATIREFEMQQSLRNALKNGEFSLVYQPQINVKEGLLIGFEALLRWNHNKFKLTPDKFIPMLEKMNLMSIVGDFVLDTALREFSEFKKNTLCSMCLYKSTCRISINMSSIQFKQKNMVSDIRQKMIEYDIESSELEIELTESALLGDAEVGYIDDLAAMGVAIAIDDFGTGYSSLKRLSALPINNIKIDKSFIDLIGVDIKTESLIKTILTLGKKLDTIIVAEGVETTQQCEFLKKHHPGIIIQGYLFSKPMTFEKFNELADSAMADKRCTFALLSKKII